MIGMALKDDYQSKVQQGAAGCSYCTSLRVQQGAAAALHCTCCVCVCPPKGGHCTRPLHPHKKAPLHPRLKDHEGGIVTGILAAIGTLTMWTAIIIGASYVIGWAKYGRRP